MVKYTVVQNSCLDNNKRVDLIYIRLVYRDQKQKVEVRLIEILNSIAISLVLQLLSGDVKIHKQIREIGVSARTDF